MLSKSICLPALVAAALLLEGCATPIQPVGERSTTVEHHNGTNYVLGQKRTVSVGEPMVKVQDYWTETIEKPVMVPDGSVRLDGGPVHISLLQGHRYPVRGRITLEGTEYTVVAVTDDPVRHQAVLVKADGSLHDRVVATDREVPGYVKMLYTMTFSNPGVKLVAETADQVQAKKGYKNFEILYAGTTANALNLTYREFSPDGLARVAFFQNLSYQAEAKNIAFQKYRIAIENATSESITFTVLQDGQ